ncbi:MAG: glycosyltransferase [Eubacteriales bacterium]|nr:glycosyltransferase [Eubacteriales bacterium]
MKIIQVIPNLQFAGAEIMCENLTYALMAMGHEVLVVSLYNEHTPIAQRMEAAGVRIRYLDKKLGLDVSMVPKLYRILRQESPDVVHTHLNVVKYAALAARLAGVEHCVHTVHNVADQEAQGRTQQQIHGYYFRHGWSVPVALSGLVQKTVVELYGLNPEQIPVIFNGIDLSKCLPKEDYRTADVVTFLHIGRFNQQKNHEGLLRAFALVHKTHPSCRLRLVGEGELRRDMEALAQTLGIGEAVEFCGLRSNVYPLLREADVFLLPSHFEGMPMTLIEAMGTGLPIVATAVGGVPDMLSDGVSALLTPCREEDVAAACEALADSEDLRRRLGLAARAASIRFSAGTMARQYLNVYEM